MKKKYLIPLIILSVIIVSIGGYFLYNYIRIKTAKIEVTLVNDLTLEFNDEKKVSDYIESINGKIIDNYTIDSLKLGKKLVKFKFINDDNIKVSYEYKVNVVDTVSPIIWLSDSYSVKKDTDIDLTKKILCGDNYDSNPNCYIEGIYDLNNVGSYPLTFNAIDNSGNKTVKEFTLNVYEPDTSNNTNNNTKPIYTLFSDVLANYKNENTEIGVDLSEWQGDVDFEKLKNAGVEFVMIRVGGTRGTNKEYFVDKKFIRNITEANKYGIDAGVYFYSYSNSTKSAIKDAKWVLKQIKEYDINLPIAYDWEEWSSFNDYNLSFFGLTNMAEEFLNTVKKSGYNGMLYSSKSYLESIWLKTDYDKWLAHYTKQTDYDGKYKMWQLCSNGKVDGINGNVDIDIMYK